MSVTVIAVLGTASSLHLGGRLRACRPLETPRCSRKLSSLSLVCPGHRPPQPPRGAGGRGRAGGAAVRLRARAAWNQSSLTRKVTPPGCGGGGDVPRDSLAGTSPTTIAIDTDPTQAPSRAVHGPPGRARPSQRPRGRHSTCGRPAVTGLLRTRALELTGGQTDRRPAGLHLRQPSALRDPELPKPSFSIYQQRAINPRSRD